MNNEELTGEGRAARLPAAVSTCTQACHQAAGMEGRGSQVLVVPASPNPSSPELAGSLALMRSRTTAGPS